LCEQWQSDPKCKQSSAAAHDNDDQLHGNLINFRKISSMTALVWTAILNGLLAPPLLVLVMLVSNNPKIMKDRVNGPAVTVLGWTTTALMFLAAIALIVTWGK
jgi:Mn2+/Fe2+ NRAMP family transporter